MSAKVTNITGLSTPSPSWKITLGFSDLPLLGEQVILNLVASPSVYALNTTLKISLPEALRFVNGDLYWNGDINANEKVQIRASVQVVALGEFKVKSWAFSSFMGENFGDAAFLDVYVTQTSATVTQLAPNSLKQGVLLTPMVITPGGGNSITVSGKFWFVLDRAIYTPVGIGGAEIEVYDEEVDYVTGLHLPWPDELVASGTTNEEGSFSISGLNNIDGLLEGGRDLYVVVYARNFVCDVVNNPWFLGGGTFSFKTAVHRDAGDHELVNFGEYTCTSEQDMAWDTFTTLQSGYWFLNSQTGLSNPQVRAFYADFFTSDTSYYLNSVYSDTAWIISMVTSMIPDELDWLGRDLVVGGLVGVHYDVGTSAESKTIRHDTMLHEYGHYVMDLYGESHPPDTIQHHHYDVAYTPGHAWVEGWAEFYSAAARQAWGVPKEEWDSPPIEANYQGDSVEGAIAGVLWDIYDSHNEPSTPLNPNGKDELSVGFEPIWNVFRYYDPDPIMGWPLGKNHSWNIYDFWDGFRTRYAGLSTIGLWQILNLHGIETGTADGVPPTNPTGYTSNIPIETWDPSGIITISWSGASDDSGIVARYAWSWDRHIEGIPSGGYTSASSRVNGETSSTNMTTSKPDFPSPTTFLNFLGEGNNWYFHVQSIDGAGNIAEGVFTVGPFYIGDPKNPYTYIDVGSKKIGEDSYVRAQDTFILSNENFDGGKNLGSIFYHIKSDSYDSGSKSFTDNFSLESLADGRYTIQYYTKLASGYKELGNTLTVVLDTTPATTTLSVGEPKYVVNPTYVTSSTPFTLKANDGKGSGVDSISYRIYKVGYDTGWLNYVSAFNFRGLSDGAYKIEFKSTDNMGNVEATRTSTVILDNTAPILMGLSPIPGVALNEGVVFQFNPIDSGSGVSSVRFSIRTSNGGQGLPVGFENLGAVYNVVTGKWEKAFNTLLLLNGDYTLIMEIIDKVGNGAPEIVQYSMQNRPIPFEADVPVRGTYLFADNEVSEWDDNGDSVKEPHSVEAPLIVDLAANGFKPGDLIWINSWGAVHYSAHVDWDQFWSGPWELYAVFSSSQTILWQPQGDELGPLQRVPGAIDAGNAFVSWPSFLGYPTDIPEDFYVPESGKNIRIPPNAAFLIIAPTDEKLTDNDGWIKVTIDKDTDEDGLWDSWETKGIDIDNDGTIDLKLEGADPMHKDIYVEVDYMEGHRFSAVARDNVAAAFRSAPVKNPDKNNGINIHIEIDDSDNLTHQDSIKVDAYTGYWPDFDTIKATHFGTKDQQKDADVLKAKKTAYHYCLMAHNYAIFDTKTSHFQMITSGGIAEPYGNDFIVSLGSWTGGAGTNEEQAGTFMHELGHNLGLRHGGGDDINYKPNYLSIMNYLFQVPYTPLVRALQTPLTYSSQAQPDLYEKSLDESKGIGAAPWPITAYSAQIQTLSGIKMVPLPISTSRGIDWNKNGYDNETKVWANINYYPSGSFTYGSANDEHLKGYNDWSNLNFNFKGSRNYEDGVHSTEFGVDELTWEIVQEMREAFFQVHNVAALNLLIPQGTVDRSGFTVNLTVANLGGSTEVCNLTIFANATSIASKTLTLLSGNMVSLSLPCEAAGLRMGRYTVTAHISSVANETYASDNILTGGILKIVDTVPPVTVAEYDGLWRIADFAVALKATDDMSGVAETFYIVNSESVVRKLSIDGEPRLTVDGLNNSLRYWSVDVSGNVEQQRLLSGIKLDKTPPSLAISSPASEGKVESSAITVAWMGSDDTSGVKGYEVRLDGGQWISVGTGTSREFTGLGDGSHTGEVRATDNVGNIKLALASFTVDTHPWLLSAVALGALVAVTFIFVFFRRSRDVFSGD